MTTMPRPCWQTNLAVAIWPLYSGTSIAVLALSTLTACGGRIDPNQVATTTTGPVGAGGSIGAAPSGGTTTTGGGSTAGGSIGAATSGGTTTTGGAGSVGAGTSGGTTSGGGSGGGGPASGCPSFPPDARDRRIAFDSDREDFARQLYVMQSDGTGVVRLLTDSYSDREPSYSPDGKHIVFASERGGLSQVFLLDLATRNVREVTRRPEGADQPSFSHDGTLIAFHSGSSVYVIRPDGTGERFVASGLDSFNAYFWPHFSLDDTELVFDRNNEIDACKLDGSGLRMIVQNTTTTIKSPAVSPDGRDVAYNAFCFFAGGQSVWTTSFSTNTEVCKGRRVSPVDEVEAQRAAWANSSVLAYESVDKATNLATISVISRDAGSVPCKITSPLVDSRNPAWSPAVQGQ
jgi:Tol biopolymer transport system component